MTQSTLKFSRLIVLETAIDPKDRQFFGGHKNLQEMCL